MSGHLEPFGALLGKLTILNGRYIPPKPPTVVTTGANWPKQLRIGPNRAQNDPKLPKMTRILLTVVPSALAGR